MSLKTFHIIFIIASIMLFFFFSWWAYQEYAAKHTLGHLTTSILSLLLGLGFIIYAFKFNQKVNT